MLKSIHPNVSSIAVTTPPTKTVYSVGESFESAGMVVTATYDDSSTGVVTGYTVSPSGALALTDTSVTITYSGKTATQAITVKNNVTTLSSVKVNGANATKDENDDWDIELTAGTTSVTTIVATTTDANATVDSITPSSFAEIVAGQTYVSTIRVTAEDTSTHKNYQLRITVAEE